MRYCPWRYWQSHGWVRRQFLRWFCDGVSVLCYISCGVLFLWGCLYFPAAPPRTVLPQDCYWQNTAAHGKSTWQFLLHFQDRTLRPTRAYVVTPAGIDYCCQVVQRDTQWVLRLATTELPVGELVILFESAGAFFVRFPTTRLPTSGLSCISTDFMVLSLGTNYDSEIRVYSAWADGAAGPQRY